MERYYFEIQYGVSRYGQAVADVKERGVSQPLANDVLINNAERIVHALNLAATTGRLVDVTA